MSFLQSSLHRVLAYLSGLPLPGLLGAGLLFALSMAPSLIPRDAVIQGMLSGVTAAVGFWFGLTVIWLWTFFELPFLTGGLAKAVHFVVSALTILLIGYSLQNGRILFAISWAWSH